MYDFVNIDKFNNSITVRNGSVDHLFSSYENFEKYSGFNFPDVLIISYEPVRNIYHVVKIGGEGFSGEDLPEIQWIKNNQEKLSQAAFSDGYGKVYEITIEQYRDSKLYETDWMVIRHRDQIDSGVSTSLSSQQYINLLNYRQELRDITKKYNKLDDVVWPLLDL